MVMVKQVDPRKLYIAMADIKDGKISYAKLNNFVVKSDKDGNVRMYNENNKEDRSVPLEHDFACFIETFEKSDLEPGMIVETRIRDAYLVLPNCFVSEDDYINLDDYNDNLTSKFTDNETFDIIRIYKLADNYSHNLEDLLNLQGVEEIANINRVL